MYANNYFSFPSSSTFLMVLAIWSLTTGFIRNFRMPKAFAFELFFCLLD